MQMSWEKCAFSSPFWTVSWFMAKTFTIYHFVLRFGLRNWIHKSNIQFEFSSQFTFVGVAGIAKIEIYSPKSIQLHDDGAAVDFSDLVGRYHLRVFIDASLSRTRSIEYFAVTYHFVHHMPVIFHVGCGCWIEFKPLLEYIIGQVISNPKLLCVDRDRSWIFFFTCFTRYLDESRFYSCQAWA